LSVWYFEERNPRAVLTFPKNEEHFAAVSGVVTSLVREITQNSGDAWAGNEPVQVQFRFGKLDANRFADHIEGLPAHLQDFSDLRAVLEGTKTVPYLGIEDFGTTGLTGSYDLSTDGSDSNYVAFWRRYGESSKSEEYGGRHGLGKSTISTASKLRLFFGATVRIADPDCHLLLQGQISLKPHKRGDKVFGAYGLLYDASGNLPIIDKVAARFANDFDLRRGKEPGLSLVIPFPDDDLTPDAIITAVIENTFHQIITGHLIVWVDDAIIDPNMIFRLANKLGLEKLKSAMTLSADVKRKAFSSLSPRPETQRLNAEHFSDSTVEELRRRWTTGEIVAVELPVRIAKKRARSEMGSVHLYVRREQNSDLRKETYVRGRVTVRLRPTTNHTNCVALLVADTGIASTFLGDTEPPAHDHWYIYRVRADYQNPRLPLQRILYSLRDLSNKGKRTSLSRMRSSSTFGRSDRRRKKTRSRGRSPRTTPGTTSFPEAA
jgi:hypothetical protein